MQLRKIIRTNWDFQCLSFNIIASSLCHDINKFWLSVKILKPNEPIAMKFIAYTSLLRTSSYRDPKQLDFMPY